MTLRHPALAEGDPMSPTEPSTPARRPSRRSRPRLEGYSATVLAITAGGALLRFALLGRHPLWRDEAFTALAVHRSVGAMLGVVAHDSAPPLSYLVQHAIVSVWSGPAGLRAPSALAGTAAIPLGAALGRRVGGDRVGLWCAAVFAVLPSLVLESRDARTYALATTLVLAATLALWRLVERPSSPRVFVYAVCTAAALTTNYFAAFAILAQLAAALVTLRPSRQAMTRAVLGAGAGVLALVPWLVYARTQFTHGSGPFWVGGVGFSTISGVVVQFFSGPSIDPGVPGQVALEAVQALVVVVGLGALVWVLARWRTRTAELRRSAGYLGLGALGAVGGLVVISVWHPLVEARYASVMWGPLVCLVGLGFAEIPWRRIAPVALASTGAAAIVLSFALTEPDTPALARRLNGHIGPHDLVSSAPAAYLLLLRYGGATTRAHTRIVAADVPWYWGTAAFPRGAVLHAYPADVLTMRGTIDFVDVPGQPRAIAPPLPYRAVRGRRCFSTICLTVYRWSSPDRSVVSATDRSPGSASGLGVARIGQGPA
jgi:4-amino-4-deoxy-L-arabinose transferase-like glycosyltransferase